MEINNDEIFEGTDIKKLKLEVFEKENPDGAKKLQKMVEKKMFKTQKEITKIVETTIDNYFKDKELNKPIPSYVG